MKQELVKQEQKMEILSDIKGSMNIKKEGGEPKEVHIDPPVPSKKLPQTYDISPKILRQFRIYNISSTQPVVLPLSRDTEWQQILQLYV